MMYITVLYGGRGGEREVSLASGLRVTKALIARGHRVHLLDFYGALEKEHLPLLHQADAIFLALHGDAGEGGTLQTALEASGIAHYTGSGPAGAALAINKALAKKAVRKVGVPVTEDLIWEAGGTCPVFSLPAIIKPLCGGSSVGLFVAQKKEELSSFSPTEPMLVEPLLSGREYTVGILNGRALPVVEIRPQGGLYDYHRKYTAGETEEICPAPIPAEKAAQLQAWALCAFEALGLRDFARVDFKENGEGTPYFLEANTLPGMTETSLLPLAAHTAEIPLPLLCEKMAMLAASRKKA